MPLVNYTYLLICSPDTARFVRSNAPRTHTRCRLESLDTNRGCALVVHKFARRRMMYNSLYLTRATSSTIIIHACKVALHVVRVFARPDFAVRCKARDAGALIDARTTSTRSPSSLVVSISAIRHNWRTSRRTSARLRRLWC